MSASPCSVDGCERPTVARGFCNTDYRRARREGRLDLKLIIGDDLTRFWSHVRITGTESCWLWKGGKTKGGYPQFSVGGKNVLAHRWAYQEFVEEIPDGLTIDHVKAWGCTSRACVRPDHLQPVTNGENVLREPPHSDQRTEDALRQRPRVHPGEHPRVPGQTQLPDLRT